MSIFSKLFGRKQAEPMRVGGMEDFMTLIRVYYQATMAANLGIANLAALPDLRVFKQTLKVPTLNNKLGLGEKKRCQKMLMDMYGLSDGFFHEADASIKKCCRNVQEMQAYFLVFQDFIQNLMMSMGQLMQLKLRLPSFIHNYLQEQISKQVHKVLTNNDWKDAAMRQSVAAVRKAQARLGYTEKWMVEFSRTLLMLAKKEPRNKIDEAQNS